MQAAPEQPFDGIDLRLPDEQLSEWLSYALNQRVQTDGDRSVVTISDEEAGLLRKWSREAGPKTRRVAVQFLVDNGPCSWEDLEKWAFDADEHVRCPIVCVPCFGPARELLESDKPRWVRLLMKAARRYPDDYWPAMAMRELVENDPGTLDVTWDSAESLLDIGDPELYTMLEVGYFEHVIPDLGLGPDDRRVSSWINCADAERQRMLLKVAAYWGLDSGRMREIVQALAQCNSKEIVQLARRLIDGGVSYGDL